MPLTDAQRKTIAEFRSWAESALTEAIGLGGVTRHDREDESTLATRWEAEPHVWFELAIRPFVPQARVGIVTDDRWKSEELEQKIEDSGDTMSEFVEAGFAEVDLDWPEPPVEHYRDQGKYFYFATALDLESVDGLADQPTRERLRQMVRGYIHAFLGPAR